VSARPIIDALYNERLILIFAVQHLSKVGWYVADCLNKDFIVSSMQLMTCSLSNTMVPMELESIVLFMLRLFMTSFRGWLEIV
jgi:hypothetical protein